MTTENRPDPYHGKGGRYVRDAQTGERRPADDSPPADPHPEVREGAAEVPADKPPAKKHPR